MLLVDGTWSILRGAPRSVTSKVCAANLARAGPAIVVGAAHGEPLGLVRAAVAHQQRARLEGDAFDEVWCVMDVENPAPHPSLEEALRLARRNRIRCALSNPCFELWLILHFDDQQAWLTSDQACRQAESLPIGYDRSSKSFHYEKLNDCRPTAIDRARRLDSLYDADYDVRGKNPWTAIQQLVEVLSG